MTFSELNPHESLCSLCFMSMVDIQLFPAKQLTPSICELFWPGSYSVRKK